MESTTIVYGVPFGKKPRSGQARVFDALNTHTAILNIKLPTGYGKTFTAAGVYSILKSRGKATRLLVIFPNDGQLEQFVKDGHGDLADTGVDGPYQIIDIRYFGAEALKKHRSNSAQVFAITIQALIQSRGMNNVGDLLLSGLWMIVVDEYHHYGLQKEWGKAVLALPRAFLLAMSATPSRPHDDSAFGAPHISVSYRDAVEELAIKPLRGHSYTYKIDAILEDGDVVSFTTSELADAAGGDDPEKIEKLRIKSKMRWSPKYVSPLVSVPIERMLRERIDTGYRLQALIGAMCVSHAELVCIQLKAIFPELVIDWVGTGQNGRSPEENKAILAKFCPQKDEHGNRHPTIDILVHVGMAGEGLDSVHGSEIVFLCNASLCNRRLQEAGRASRYLPDVTGNVNFDSSSEFAAKGYTGKAIMDAMDYAGPTEEKTEKEKEEREPKPLPEEPTIQIHNMELLHIDSGSAQVKRMAEALRETGVGGLDYSSLKGDPSHPHWAKVCDAYRFMRAQEAEALNEKAVITQWKESVDGALSVVTRRVIKRLLENGARFEKSLPGDIKTRINYRKASILGKVKPDLEAYKAHYRFLQKLEVEIIETGIPLWLS